MSCKIFQVLTRRKTDSDDDGKTKLDRCLGLLDLTALGVGATLGLGVYVLAGSVAKTVAGPAVCLSFLAAAVASAFAGVCYAEFAARVPKAGSAYVYSYVTVGEFIAFVIGWNLILEYVIGTASVARGLSNYIDALADNKISEAFLRWLPINMSYLSPYPDFLAFTVVLILTAAYRLNFQRRPTPTAHVLSLALELEGIGKDLSLDSRPPYIPKPTRSNIVHTMATFYRGLLSFGVKESSMLNNLFTVLNLLTVAIVLVCGSIKADTDNWKIPQEQIPEGYGTGGFMPYGIAGVMAGAAKCFYGFVGFDAVATTGEEAKNPQKDIPLAIVISLLVIFGAYFSVSTVLTMMWPYYLQDVNAPFPYVFEQVGWTTIKWIVTSGAVFALCTSMLGAMFPLPRVIYAMANDGIVFKPLGKINSWSQTPIIATILSGVFSGFMAMIFDLDQLIDMMSIGTLLAYTIVAICVLILRYQVDETKVIKNLDKDANVYNSTFFNGFVEIFNLHNNKEANPRTSRITNWSIVIFSIFSALFASIVINVPSTIFVEPFYCVGFVVSLVAMLVLMFVIARQPVAEIELSFKVPLVPFIPCISVFFNLYLMLELDLHTWIRFIVWLILGFMIYFFYGIRNSVEGKKLRNQDQPLRDSIKSFPNKDTMSIGSYSPYNPK